MKTLLTIFIFILITTTLYAQDCKVDQPIGRYTLYLKEPVVLLGCHVFTLQINKYGIYEGGTLQFKITHPQYKDDYITISISSYTALVPNIKKEE
jgi:hypothetical protein